MLDSLVELVIYRHMWTLKRGKTSIIHTTLLLIDRYSKAQSTLD